ncbi:CPBP family intramembrane metalloprotease [Anaerocolumna sp. AGMB13025]|uniref:CPBP family intramembrane glutamic endopeptidase n=1 Tax=Anaerocolumna sp. AGMB13025 TaxID=3039116 RepID=UPI00241ECC61|nr:CPBP family intramembrane glutamic endopeptidase [Anaerocolumna sp. AGMB13025]WFR54796.1 CPBP family intramembrane metalloprotease [Anaerocolumna sp. AGMB13025]
MENFILALFDTGTIQIIVAILMGLSLYCMAFFAIANKWKHINHPLLGYVLYLSSFSGVIIYLLTNARNREVFNHSNFFVSYEFKFSWFIIILPVMLNAINYIFNRITNKQVKYYKNKSVKQNIVQSEKKTAPYPFHFIYTILLAPTIEEILFRGILFWHIYLKFGLIPAMVINSMIFAFLHLKLRVLIFSFFGGLIFSYLTFECNSLYAAILAHCFYNFLNFVPGIFGKINFVLSKNSLGGKT